MYLSEAKASHSHKMWTEVSPSVHLLHLGSFPIPIIYKCLLKVLCPISRPVTTLAWVLLRDNSRAPVAWSRPGINSRACLCILQVPHHNARCCFRNQRGEMGRKTETLEARITLCVQKLVFEQRLCWFFLIRFTRYAVIFQYCSVYCHWTQQSFIAFINNATCFGPSSGPSSGIKYIFKTHV